MLFSNRPQQETRLAEQLADWEDYDPSLTAHENLIELALYMGLLDEAHTILKNIRRHD